MRILASTESLVWRMVSLETGIERRELIKDISCSLTGKKAERVYSTGRRHVYRVDSDTLGPLAIKEVVYPSTLKQIKNRLYRKPKAVSEFENGEMFAKQGVATHRLYALVKEQSWFRLRRIFIVMEWLEGAVTLTEHVKRNNGILPDEQWQDLAFMLVDSANRGLIHHGHSSDNVMVTSLPTTQPLGLDTVAGN